MDFVLAALVCTLVGLGVGLVVHRRARGSSFARIGKHVTLLVVILLFALFLFARLGLNLWSATIIPLASLALAFIIIKRAVAKILEVH